MSKLELIQGLILGIIFANSETSKIKKPFFFVNSSRLDLFI